MEYGDRSREPSVRRAPSRFVRRPGNPECGFVRRPTFLFLPRSFGLLLVALFAFSPPFLRQESRKESGRDACIPMLSSTVGTNSRACLFFFLPASPRLSTRFSPMQSLTPPFPPLFHKLQTFFFLRAKNEETSSIPSIIELANEHGIRTRGYLLHKDSEIKPFHSMVWFQNLSNRPNPKDFYQYELIFSDTILSCPLRIAIVPFVESVP